MMMSIWLVLVIVLIVTVIGSALLGLGIAKAIQAAKQGGASAVERKPKRKHEDDDPFLERLAEDDVSWQADDDAPPVDLDMLLAADEKPKRHEDG